MSTGRVFNSTPGPLVYDEAGHTVDGYGYADDVDLDGRTSDGSVAHALLEAGLLSVVEDPQPEPAAARSSSSRKTDA